MKKSSEPSNSKYLQRINYLQQIEQFTLLRLNNPTLSTHYASVRDSLTKKAVLKTDPNMKRNNCKRCKCVLYHGITAKVSIQRKNNSPVVRWKCSNCNFVKRYTVTKGKRLWYENPESTKEVQKC